MTKKFFILAFLVGSFSAFACELAQNEKIKIGCTYSCDFFYRARLHLTAWSLGYSIDIKDLSDQSDVGMALKEVDAVLLPGGADIDPKYYLSHIETELRDYTQKNRSLVVTSSEGPARDRFEYQLVKTYSDNDTYKKLPMLGICRGLQMMSVAQGIPLYLDLETETKLKNRRYQFDEISFNEDSLFGEKTVSGFKLHHQGIRVPYYLKNRDKFPRTKITAYSNNRTIAEAIEYTHRPALGVQYHPERSLGEGSSSVFQWLLNKACEYKKEKI